MEIKEFDPMPVPLALGWLFYLVRLIHEFAKNFHNFISYKQLCNLA